MKFAPKCDLTSHLLLAFEFTFRSMKTLLATVLLLGSLFIGVGSAHAEGCLYIADPGETFTPDLTSDRCFVVTMTGPLTVSAPVNVADGTDWTLLIYNDGCYPVLWDAKYKSNMTYVGGDCGQAMGRVFSVDGVQYMNTLLTQ